MFGERDIGDLHLPFFCVSSDLTEGALHVHERGKLWIALRASSDSRHGAAGLPRPARWWMAA